MTVFGQLYRRNIRQMPRIPAVLVFGVMMPIIQLLLFGSVFQSTIEHPDHPLFGVDISYYTFIAPAIILLTAVIGMANSSAAFIVDLRTGYFDKLRTTPASPSGVIFARLMAEMTRVFLQGVLILSIAVAIGGLPETGILGGLLILLAAVMFGTMTTGMAVMILAMKTRSDQATQAMFPLFFLLLFMSTAFMPENLLPDWLATIASFNPVDYMIQGMRGLMITGWDDALVDLAIGLGLGAVVGFVLMLVNIRVYKRIIG